MHRTQIGTTSVLLLLLGISGICSEIDLRSLDVSMFEHEEVQVLKVLPGSSTSMAITTNIILGTYQLAPYAKTNILVLTDSPREIGFKRINVPLEETKQTLQKGGTPPSTISLTIKAKTMGGAVSVSHRVSASSGAVKAWSPRNGTLPLEMENLIGTNVTVQLYLPLK